jgi:ABC-type lipoprotein export system ATPase subunit
MNNSKGSLWRKWDLHFHTPSSYDYQDKSITNEKIVEKLVAKGIRVVAITDHHVIDEDRIRELQKIGKGQITVLPGIEFCSELGGSNSVHFVGIFHEDVNINYIWQTLSVSLQLTKIDINRKGGYQNVYTDFKKASKLIHDLHGLVSVHAGKKTNSIESISSKDLFKQVLKTDLLKDHIDILEIGNVNEDKKLYQDMVFPAIKYELPLIICSDNHSISQYQTKTDFWVKADPGFYGLLQTLVEPTRIYLGDKPDKRLKVAGNKTKYISSVTINKNDESPLDEVWFDKAHIEMNHDLVAIIGNKGTGKSALAEVIGLLGNTKNDVNFGFLSPQRFRTPRNNLAAHFHANLEWENGDSDLKTLDQDVDHKKREKVKFIPQGLFEDICNDIATGKDNKFNEELEKVIFSHVKDADRYGKNSLRELINYLTNTIYDNINILKQQLHGINERIAETENKLSGDYLIALQNQIETKRKELESHDSVKPKDISSPERRHTQIANKLSARIELNKQKLIQLEDDLEKANKDEQSYALKVSSADIALDLIANFKEQYKLFKNELSEPLNIIGVKFEDIAKLEIKTSEIIHKRSAFEALKEKALELQAHDTDKSIPKKLEIADKKLQSLQDQLDEPTKLYETYVTSLREWNRGRDAIIGSAKTLGSLTFYESELKAIDKLPEKLNGLKVKRMKFVKKIYLKITELVKTYRTLYGPVQMYSDIKGISNDTFELKFDVSIINSDLENKFFNRVVKNRVGSFYGDGEKTLKSIIDRYDFNNWINVEAFLSTLIEYLSRDQRQPDKPLVLIKDQLRKGKDDEVISFYDDIFSLDYLRPNYVLKLGERELGELSPGERGALLLIFYLLVDRDDIPLIIDQPEENLDNQTVYQHLVHSIKTAKERRQIIVVTHNPNLAVVCDAEQIICCSIDKKHGNRIVYTTGAIENPEINTKIVDILEGTKPAFNNRNSKYSPFGRIDLFQSKLHS